MPGLGHVRTYPASYSSPTPSHAQNPRSCQQIRYGTGTKSSQGPGRGFNEFKKYPDFSTKVVGANCLLTGAEYNISSLLVNVCGGTMMAKHEPVFFTFMKFYSQSLQHFLVILCELNMHKTV